MSEGETDLLADLLVRLDALVLALKEDEQLLGEAPETLDTFAAMTATRRSGSRALMKSFEQLEDQIARTFRIVAQLLGVDTDNWYMQDFADFMEKNGVLAEASDWMLIVKLRNRLVHDYPIQPAAQLAKLAEVVERIPLLIVTHRRLIAFIASRRLST